MVKMKTDIIRRTDVSGYTDHTIKETLKQIKKIMTESPSMSYDSYKNTYFDKTEEIYRAPIEREPREYKIDATIPLIFKDIEGEPNVATGVVQVVDVENDIVLFEKEVSFKPN